MQEVRYRNYLLTILMLMLAFNFVDRAAMSMMLEGIKHDLQLSDTQLGVMTGFAFAVFYSVLGIPIARWADRGNRVTILTVTTLLWSAAVVLCGFATTFAQLLMVRIAVAVGEAGCQPAAQSLISDEFTRAERPRAMARFLVGGPLSSVVGYFVAGWLSEVYGWRVTFMLLGIPGIVLGFLCWWTLREPREGDGPGSAQVVSYRIGEVVAIVRRIPSFRNLLMCVAVMWFLGNGLSQWQPTYFIRTFGMTTGELGAWFAGIWTVGGVIGMYCGGELASRGKGVSEAVQLRRVALVLILFMFLNTSIYLVDNYHLAFVFLFLSAIAFNLIQAPIFSSIQTLVPPNMRAFAVAVVFLFANLIGMGFGPTFAGALSDFLHSRGVDDSLRYAIMLLCPGYIWAAWHALRASRTLEGDIAAASPLDAPTQMKIARGGPV